MKMKTKIKRNIGDKRQEAVLSRPQPWAQPQPQPK